MGIAERHLAARRQAHPGGAQLLNYIIAFYLIAIGLIGIFRLHQLHVG